MDMSQLTGVFSNFAGGITSFMIVALILSVLGGLVLFLWRGGLMNRYSYRPIIFSPAGKDYKINITKGRYLGEGFEVHYGYGDNVKTQAPPPGAVRADGTVVGYSPSRNSIFWITDLFVDDKQIRIDPTISEAMKLAHAQAVREEVERATKPSPYEKYIVPLSVVVGFVIIGIALYVGINSVVGPLNNFASANMAIHQDLADAQVVIYRESQSSGGSSFPNPPTQNVNPNAPPG